MWIEIVKAWNRCVQHSFNNCTNRACPLRPPSRKPGLGWHFEVFILLYHWLCVLRLWGLRCKLLMPFSKHQGTCSLAIIMNLLFTSSSLLGYAERRRGLAPRKTEWWIKHWTDGVQEWSNHLMKWIALPRVSFSIWQVLCALRDPSMVLTEPITCN